MLAHEKSAIAINELYKRSFLNISSLTQRVYVFFSKHFMWFGLKADILLLMKGKLRGFPV